MKKPNQVAIGPISFTADEIEQARAGNFALVEKRVEQELSLRAHSAVDTTQAARHKRAEAVHKRRVRGS
jgi:hypothetical protein